MSMAPENRQESGAGRRIDEELVCIESLKYVLHARCGCNRVEIFREEHDPPDFTVTIDGESLPAEVTSVVLRQEYHAHCEEFARVVGQRAGALGLLAGKYAFTVTRMPHIPKPTSREGQRLLQDAVAYVAATKQQAESPEILLSTDPGGKITMAKVSASGSAVGLVWMAPMLWEGEVQDELASLLQRHVDAKRRKLEKVRVAPAKALLLLYDAYGYAQPDDA
ncbi:MAG TPA: hypothetical protein VKD72_06150, partial [Gemmataceae bacterium]|nr:hypothetical protein [Gemmataceae bacterium]